MLKEQSKDRDQIHALLNEISNLSTELEAKQSKLTSVQEKHDTLSSKVLACSAVKFASHKRTEHCDDLRSTTAGRSRFIIELRILVAILAIALIQQFFPHSEHHRYVTFFTP
jgi:hypothetical protein